MKLLQNDRILFNGDSTTDADRDRADTHSLSGYSKKIHEHLTTQGIDGVKLNIECFNRAISGDTSAQMLKRFSADCEDTKPTLISLLIGINDTWRRYDSGVCTSSVQFADNYYQVLRIAQKFTGRIMLLEPFILPVDPEKMPFYEDLYEKILAVRLLAREFKTAYIPLDGIFAESCAETTPSELSEDGIHPTDKGHRLIAREWLKRCTA
jgi:lysophospholipase L1-like esterase